MVVKLLIRQSITSAPVESFFGYLWQNNWYIPDISKMLDKSYLNCNNLKIDITNFDFTNYIIEQQF
jgi:hypothetical protein